MGNCRSICWANENVVREISEQTPDLEDVGQKVIPNTITKQTKEKVENSKFVKVGEGNEVEEIDIGFYEKPENTEKIVDIQKKWKAKKETTKQVQAKELIVNQDERVVDETTSYNATREKEKEKEKNKSAKNGVVTSTPKQEKSEPVVKEHNSEYDPIIANLEELYESADLVKTTLGKTERVK